MFGWLKEKNENARVYMCTKEVLWDLDAADQMKRARILAMANLYREMLLIEGDIPPKILSNPLHFSRTDLMKIYNVIEDARNISQNQFDITQKNMQNFGIELPAFSAEHFKNNRRALEIWMVILGAGIKPDLRDQARLIWNNLESARNILPEAIAQLYEINKQTNALTNSDEDMFSGISSNEWLGICKFQPEIFVHKITSNDGITDNSKTRQDEVAVEAILTCKSLGANTARECAEMILGHKMTDLEWEKIHEPWERNWENI